MKMRRNVCEMIEEIKGTKSTKIMELINRKLQKDKERMLNAHIKDNKLKGFYVNYKTKKAELERAKGFLDKRKDELDLEWGGYDGAHYRIKDRCRIAKEDFEALQEAQDKFSLGKKKEAQEIWEKIITKHKLFEEEIEND